MEALLFLAAGGLLLFSVSRLTARRDSWSTSRDGWFSYSSAAAIVGVVLIILGLDRCAGDSVCVRDGAEYQCLSDDEYYGDP